MATIGKAGVPLSDTEKAEFRTDLNLLSADDATVVTDVKSAPVDDDELIMTDSENGGSFVKVKKSELLTAIMSTVSDLASQIASLTDAINGKQDTLDSSNLKTINGISLLGSGNITISGTTTSAPLALTVGQWSSTPGDGQISINILVLPDDGGSAITALEYTLDGSTWIALSGTGTGVRIVSSLTNDIAYPVQVRAVNAIDNGDPSDIKNTTPVAASGGTGLTIVQDPDKIEGVSSAEITLASPVTSGNGLIVTVRCQTAGTPVMSDDQGGTWPAAIASVSETPNGTTAHYYILNNVTSGLDTITVNAAGSYETSISVVEATGGTLTLDDVIDVEFGTTIDPWDVNFTSADDDSIVVGVASFSNSTTITSVPPLTSNATAEYFGYFRGLFTTAGSNVAQLDLSDGRQGSVSGIIVRGV